MWRLCLKVSATLSHRVLAEVAAVSTSSQLFQRSTGRIEEVISLLCVNVFVLFKTKVYLAPGWCLCSFCKRRHQAYDLQAPFTWYYVLVLCIIGAIVFSKYLILRRLESRKLFLAGPGCLFFRMDGEGTTASHPLLVTLELRCRIMKRDAPHMHGENTISLSLFSL